MSKKLKGFSLAELLIALLVISIVLSAAIPTLTRKSSQDREQIWKWSKDNNSAYFGLGANQSVLIGTPNTPMDTADDAETPVSLAVMMTDDKGTNSTEIEYNGPRFTTDGDKLMILKKSLQGHTTNMANSHISFYNIDNNAATVTENMSYGGRIAVDKHNIAFGRATLLHMDDLVEGDDYESSFYGENTAIGHFALMNTKDGSKNVALGEKTLTLNKSGDQNTALGFLAGNKIGHRDRENTKEIAYQIVKEIALVGENGEQSDYPSYNTAIGASALEDNEFGFGNTAVGASAAKENYEGDYNTLVGYNTMSDLDRGFSNTAIGTNACGNMGDGNYNICIGNQTTTQARHQHNTNFDNYGLAIGSSKLVEYNQTFTSYDDLLQRSVPIITGHTQRTGLETGGAGPIYIKNPTLNNNQAGYYDKELIVNAKDVEFKPFHGGHYPTFVFTSVPGDINDTLNDGYGANKSLGGGVSASAFFNLRFVAGVADSGSVTMQFKALPNKPIIAAFDPNKITNQSGHNIAKLHNISFNELIKFEMPDNHTNYPTWVPAWKTTESTLAVRSPNQNVVGIIADEYTNMPGIGEADIFINNRLNIARRANHIINLDDQGTQIFDLGNKKPFEVNINGDADKPNLSVGNDNISLNANTNIEFKIADSPILHMNDRGITAKAELYIDTLNFPTTSPKSVKFALDYLKDNKADRAELSDARLKNISGDNTAGLAEINKLEVKNYTYKNDEKKTPHVGVIAQQLQKIFPNSVIKGEDGYLRIKKEEIFYAMVNSIKELFAKLQDLTAKVVGLDKRITELEAQNKMLLEQNKAFEKRLEKLEKQAAK